MSPEPVFVESDVGNRAGNEGSDVFAIDGGQVVEGDAHGVQELHQSAEALEQLPGSQGLENRGL